MIKVLTTKEYIAIMKPKKEKKENYKIDLDEALNLGIN